MKLDHKSGKQCCIYTRSLTCNFQLIHIKKIVIGRHVPRTIQKVTSFENPPQYANPFYFCCGCEKREDLQAFTQPKVL